MWDSDGGSDNGGVSSDIIVMLVGVGVSVCFKFIDSNGTRKTY